MPIWAQPYTLRAAFTAGSRRCRLPIRMSSNNSTSKPSKLIFAPGEAPSDAHAPSSHQQAAQFQVGSLSRKDLNPDPLVQFHEWFSEPALKGTVPETVTLSTAELPSGRVKSRMVYLKELDDRGFVIYSNWGTSQKAHDITTNPYASLCFWWKPLERQVRIEGPAERLSTAESQTYFNTRARGSRIGAWASQQSSILPPSKSPKTTNQTSTSSEATTKNENGEDGEKGEEDDGRLHLENQVRQIETKFKDVEEIPVPDFWGGLRVLPEMIEFWQGRDSRLHDRFRYTKIKNDGSDGGDGSKGWKIERLSP